MKKVRELKKWIELYNEVNAAAEELQLAYEYVKEEIITEDEVDAAYAKALELVENLEFRNMLRDEADQMSCVLKINSGAGGTESQDWASMLMRMYCVMRNPIIIKYPLRTCRKVMRRVSRLSRSILKAIMLSGI